MKFILVIIIFQGCAHHEPRSEDLVSLGSALNQAKASYLKGCVQGMNEIGLPDAFLNCRIKSEDHLKELNEIMNQGF